MCIKRLADQAWGIIHLTASFFAWAFKNGGDYDDWGTDVFDQAGDRS